MPVKLNSSGGGSVTLDVPVTASNFTLTVPARTGNISTGITLETSKTATGANVDFTGIPSWVRRITVMFNGVSTNGTSLPLFQLGTSSGVETTGYTAVGGGVYGTTGNTGSSTAGFPLNSNLASNVISGAVTFTTMGSNTWVGSGNFCAVTNANQTMAVSGVKSLAGAVDRIRITTVNGTDQYDAGTINIMYEG